MLEFDAARRGKTLVLGHRGADGYAPENTMVSFEKGLECGADLLELDIHLSADGEIVVMHDADVSRTTDGSGSIERKTLAEIKKLDAGAKFGEKFRGERVPTLRELLDWSRDKIPLVIEIKGDPFPAVGIEEKLVAMLRDYGLVGESMAISFHHSSLVKIKKLEPALATGILCFGEFVDFVGAARAALADSVRPGWQYWSAEAVQAVSDAGLVPSTWNADDETVMGRMVPMGIASIGSNYPDRLRAYVDKAGKGMHSH
ncbi:MAG TPA: glycerophosphodiester phosphodiesterase family protein [Spirochaetales bacterium]|nr:glycerophosphodiester phosphodiesterase family protein [Spirochaetales bacterium]HRY56020.1 glycerophosphodiester phosphodiesterase family protein [Spirochaetia bacterium]